MRRMVIIDEMPQTIDVEEMRDLTFDELVRHHSNIEDVYDRLVEEYEWDEERAKKFVARNNDNIKFLMTINGLNPFDCVDTITLAHINNG